MSASRAVTLAGFVLLGLAFVALQTVAYLRPGRVPTLGQVLDGIMRQRTGRIAILVAWWWVGWHFITPY